MAVMILKRPIIDRECKTQEIHSPHRYVTSDKFMPALQKVVCGNDVIEIGCGVFGGLAEAILNFGCHSYVGIDVSVGDPETTTYGAGTDSMGFSHRVPCVISIPEKLEKDTRANFFFGIDFRTFFAQIKGDNVVTVSTGFFHDFLLMPDGRGENYVEKGISEIARVTKKGLGVGLHYFHRDECPKLDSCYPETGLFFRYCFRKYGVYPRPLSYSFCENLWLLDKF
jgi:hypothetical protein